MHNSNMIFQASSRRDSDFTLVTLVRKCVGLHVTLKMIICQESFSTQLARMWSVVKMSVDMSFVKAFVFETLTTV